MDFDEYLYWPAKLASIGIHHRRRSVVPPIEKGAPPRLFGRLNLGCHPAVLVLGVKAVVTPALE